MDASLEGCVALELASVVFIEFLLAEQLGGEGWSGWGGSTGKGLAFFFKVEGLIYFGNFSSQGAIIIIIL